MHSKFIRVALIVFIFSAAYLFPVQAQIPANNRFNNDSIKFIAFEPQPDWDTDDPMFPIRILRVTSLDSTDWGKLRNLKNSEWISLLNNPDQDWAANLVLYHIHKKTAVHIRNGLQRKDWLVKGRREKDLAFWGKYLETVADRKEESNQPKRQ